jgi:hypothetical protein
MSYPALVVDAAPAPSAQAAPVYVYGSSGRCWKFNDPSKVDEYFKRLGGFHARCPYPYSAKLYDWLLEKYGPTIFSRINLMKRGLAPIIEPCEHEVIITNSDGTITPANPTRWKHTFTNVNITIFLNVGYECDEYKHLICKDFFDKTDAKPYKDHQTNILNNAINMNGLFLDYWKGDRVIYSEPQVRPTPAPVQEEPAPLPLAPVVEEPVCLPFLRYRGRRVSPSSVAPVKTATRSQEYTPLMIEIN